MLQQTTVATVIPYYQKFTARWPNVIALANADEQDIMHEWAGLGYYSRARNLLACARKIATEYHGQFPDTIDALKTLPGIGDYTANAIRSIAFDLPANVVDGNVERVVSRLFAFTAPMNEPKNKKEIRTLASHLLPDTRHGDYAQALMDLGATICTPRNPLCHACPWQNNCSAFAKDLTTQIPHTQRRAKLPERYMAAFILRDTAHRIFLRQRPSSGLLGGLWEPPSTAWIECEDGHDMAIETTSLPENMHFQKLSKPVIHVFSHFKLVTDIYICDTLFDQNDGQTNNSIGPWFTMDTLPPLSTLSRKIMDAAQNHTTKSLHQAP